MPLFDDEIKNLQRARDVDAIRFVSVSKLAEWPKNFTCYGLTGICNWPEYDRNRLAGELNEAIAPVIAKYRDKFAGSVSRMMSVYPRDDA